MHMGKENEIKWIFQCKKALEGFEKMQQVANTSHEGVNEIIHS